MSNLIETEAHAIAAEPAMLAASKEFEHELEVFRKEAFAATQYFYSYLAINEELSLNKKALRAINTASLLWNTMVAGLHLGFFMTLGRIFDHTSRHNIDQLLKATQNLEIFSRDALTARKTPHLPDKKQLSDYVNAAYFPTAADVRLLKRLVDVRRKVYQGNYDAIRDQIYAHKELSDTQKVLEVYAKTNVTELEQLFTFLNQLHEALWNLYHNGRKPDFYPMEHSTKNIMNERWTERKPKTIPELTVVDAQHFLQLLSKMPLT